MIHNNIQLHKHNTDELRRKGAPAGGRGGEDALHTAPGLSARSFILPLPHIKMAQRHLRCTRADYGQFMGPAFELQNPDKLIHSEASIPDLHPLLHSAPSMPRSPVSGAAGSRSAAVCFLRRKTTPPKRIIV
ncbi:hypothetical protein CRENBAI_004588 [Crenichthys baileyi]|uniref:Uncharacterized protein n=1 Tax=Crenichthys baileyi TaxID=28760 RepID=A0AAV9SDX3_9TELE